MDVAACTLPVDCQCDWLAELERILERFDEMSSVARDAVGSVVESFLHDPHTTAAEIAQVKALLARHHRQVASDRRGSHLSVRWWRGLRPSVATTSGLSH